MADMPEELRAFYTAMKPARSMGPTQSMQAVVAPSAEAVQLQRVPSASDIDRPSKVFKDPAVIRADMLSGRPLPVGMQASLPFDLMAENPALRRAVFERMDHAEGTSSKNAPFSDPGYQRLRTHFKHA